MHADAGVHSESLDCTTSKNGVTLDFIILYKLWKWTKMKKKSFFKQHE